MGLGASGNQIIDQLTAVVCTSYMQAPLVFAPLGGINFYRFSSLL